MRQEHSQNRRRIVLAIGALPFAASGANAVDVEEKRTGGPYVPTPQVVVDEMLKMGRVGPNDFLVDLGSGDGVIVLTAAQRYKTRGIGVDIDPELVHLSNSEAKKRGIADRAAFRVEDVFKADLGKATVVTLYLLPAMMVNLRPKLLKELRPGTRVVSHDYHFGDWAADDQYTWDVPEKEKVNGVPRATVYLWIVPARVAGKWQLELEGPGAAKYELALKQQFQNLDGAVSGAAAKGGLKLTQSSLRGESISFAFPASGGRHLFKGTVSGDRMEGNVELAGSKGTAKWSAVRIKA
jgi:hypothetical protein